jgi:hypothetical protein
VLIRKTLTDCVCFVCRERSSGVYEPLGTGFFLGVPIGNPESPKHVSVVITALHVITDIEGAGQTPNKIYLRVNTKEGGVEHVYIPPENWIRPGIDDQIKNGKVDAAVCWFPGNNSPTGKYDYLLMPASNEIAFRQFLDDEDIGVGDDVFFTGLFTYHAGTERNEPIVRSGMIAAMAETISTMYGPQHAFLVESRSMGGFSGSPVFVTPGLMRFDEEGKLKLRPTFGSSYLIGVISGHWDAPEDVQIMGGLAERTSLNMGVAKVTAMEKVFPLIAECIEKFQSTMVEVVKKTIVDVGTAVATALVDLLQTVAAAQQAAASAAQQAAAAQQDQTAPPGQPTSTAESPPTATDATEQ